MAVVKGWAWEIALPPTKGQKGSSFHNPLARTPRLVDDRLAIGEALSAPERVRGFSITARVAVASDDAPLEKPTKGKLHSLSVDVSFQHSSVFSGVLASVYGSCRIY